MKSSKRLAEKVLLGDRAVQGLENNRDEIMALRAFDLLEGLNVVVFRAVHDRKDFCHEAGFITRPTAA